jgi:hypothetical protein
VAIGHPPLIYVFNFVQLHSRGLRGCPISSEMRLSIGVMLSQMLSGKGLRLRGQSGIASPAAAPD